MYYISQLIKFTFNYKINVELSVSQGTVSQLSNCQLSEVPVSHETSSQLRNFQSSEYLLLVGHPEDLTFVWVDRHESDMLLLIQVGQIVLELCCNHG